MTQTRTSLLIKDFTQQCILWSQMCITADADASMVQRKGSTDQCLRSCCIACLAMLHQSDQVLLALRGRKLRPVPSPRWYTLSTSRCVLEPLTLASGWSRSSPLNSCPCVLLPLWPHMGRFTCLSFLHPANVAAAAANTSTGSGLASSEP